MGGIEGSDGMNPGVQQDTEHFAKSIATIGHGKQPSGILRSHLTPAAGDGVGRLAGGERAFELVRSDEQLQRQNDDSFF